MATRWRAWGRDLVRLQRPPSTGRAPRRVVSGVEGIDAIRAGSCAGGAVLIGWWAGDLSAGLTASIGAFTALYGGRRPYGFRARQLAAIALAFAVVTTIGAWSEFSVWVSVPVVAAIAVAATALCQAFDTGPPGAYMFVLACATASGIPGATAEPWRLCLLVLAGGVLSWCAHMIGVVAGPRRPEKATLAAGVAAVTDLLEAAGSDRYPATRDRAARAMHACWVALVGQQVRSAGADGTLLARLRAIALEAHGVMAEALRAHEEGRPVDAAALARLRTLAAEVARPPASPLDPGDVPLGGPGVVATARAMLAAGSPWRVVLLRVGVAALVVGTGAALVGLDHAYWAVACAVLVLCQGLGWTGTLGRAVLRLLGTWLGLLLAAAILAAQPAGVWLASTIAVLQGAIQLAMPRNYGLGVVLVTPIALTIGSAGHPADLGGLLIARGVDTAVGCAIGVVVFLLIAPGAAVPDPAARVRETLRAVRAVLPHLVDGSTGSPDAREARRDLDQRLLALGDAHRAADDAPPFRRLPDATAWWPALGAAQRLAQQTLAACWSVDAARSEGRTSPPLTPARAAAIDAELTDLTRPAPSVPRHGFLEPELDALRRTLPAAGDVRRDTPRRSPDTSSRASPSDSPPDRSSSP